MNSTDRSLLHVYFDSQTAAKFINDLVSSTVQLMCEWQHECAPVQRKT